MFIFLLYLVTALIGSVIGFWIRGQFRDFFSSSKEYHLHMITMFSFCILTFYTIINCKQTFAL